MAGAPGAALVRIAALRSRIAVLARGGEYEMAGELLRTHAAADLGLGLPADAVRRAHQAAALAEHLEDPTHSAESLLLLAIGLIQTGDTNVAVRAAELSAVRAADGPAHDQRRLLACADLVLGVAERVRGDLVRAKTVLDRARQRCEDLARPELTAAVLVELGLIELAANATDAAVTCFWFARDFYRLANAADSAARTAALPLIVYAAAGRWADVALLAPAIAEDASAQGLAEVVARVRGLEADAHAAEQTSDALALARLAADVANALPDGTVRRELSLRARLRLVRLSTEPLERLRHLEAALDQGVSAADVPAIAALADALLDELAGGRVPPGAADLLDEVSAVLRRLGAFELADLAAAARAELQ